MCPATGCLLSRFERRKFCVEHEARQIRVLGLRALTPERTTKAAKAIIETPGICLCFKQRPHDFVSMVLTTKGFCRALRCVPCGKIGCSLCMPTGFCSPCYVRLSAQLISVGQRAEVDQLKAVLGKFQHLETLAARVDRRLSAHTTTVAQHRENVSKRR